jgi:translation elongation factor EF-G
VEAFHHLRRLIERVNALASTLLNSELMARDELNANNNNNTRNDDEEDPLIEIWNFAPEKGNVVFASAIDGWGFGIGRFALFWAKQLSLNKNVVQKHMFDDFAFNKVTKKIVKVDPSNPNAKPMFVTMVLEPIWQMYNVAITEQNSEKAAKMAKRLGVEIAKRDIYSGGAGKSQQTGASSTAAGSTEAYRGTLQAIMRAWLPLADAVLRTVVRIVPDPVISQQLKSDHYFPPCNMHDSDKGTVASKQKITESIQQISNGVSSCRPGNDTSSTEEVGFKIEDTVNTVVFIAKMVPVRIADLSPKDAEIAIKSIRSERERKKKNDDEAAGDEGNMAHVYDNSIENINNAEVFLALGRVFSGTLSAESSQSVYCLGNHHNPFEYEAVQDVDGNDLGDSSNPSDGAPVYSSAQRVPLSALSFYMCLGPSVLPVESVPAGNIVCIFGLQDYVLKSSTLCSTPYALPMRAITFQTKPMLRVAVEPKNHYNLRDLESGLQQLYQYDPVVEIGVDDLGQSTITCLGELHLELCLKALSEKFAKCEVVASAPLVPFRETVVTVPSSRNITAISLTPTSPAVSSAQFGPSATGLEKSLPPPWKDLSGINQVHRIFPANATSVMHGSSQSGSGMDANQQSCGAVHRLVVTSQLMALTFRCFSLPTSVSNFLIPDAEESSSSNARCVSEFVSSYKFGTNEENDGLGSMQHVWDHFTTKLFCVEDSDESLVDHCLLDDSDRDLKSKNRSSKDATEDCNPDMPSLLNRMISLGPHSAGPNMLLFSPSAVMELYEDTVPIPLDVTDKDTNTDDTRSRFDFSTSKSTNESVDVDGSKLLTTLCQQCPEQSVDKKEAFQHIWSRLRGSVVSGFQMLTASGPLMQEPLQGVCFSIEKIEISARVTGLDDAILQKITTKDESAETEVPSFLSPLMFSTGHLISDVRDSLRLCMLGCALRLVEPIYKCSLQCDQLQLGNLYGVLSRRRGVVTDEDIIEGTSLFILTVSLPVANSFGFAQELLQKTSGSGTAPQLFFSHWSVNELDPFWKPTTTEEQEEHGTDGTVEHNLSRSFIDGVRRRKGLVVEEKMVVSAEKQRTLTRNK